MGDVAMDVCERVLSFWFEGDYNARRKIWFQKDDTFDASIKKNFAEDVIKAAAGGYDALMDTAQGALALIIMLDQFPRNLYRGTAGAFASDAKALALARLALDKGYDAKMSNVQKMFVYLPFEHSENLDDQKRSVELCEAMGEENEIKYAVMHYDIIAEFGRFPHRNQALGRDTTAQEHEFMKTFKGF